MMISTALLTLTLTSILSKVHAHGFVHDVVIGSQVYTGWNPFVDPYASPIPERIVRKIPSDGPITDITDPDLACNVGGKDGTGLVATAAAGGQVVFEWDYWPADHLGPVSTYMTSCNGDCTQFDVTGAEWFKVDASGYDNGVWASAQLISNNDSWTSTIPADLAPGQYLMRHEIVALHSIGQPQFYPSCSQVNVSGTGSGLPSSQDTVLIPGLYNGVQWPDIYTDFGNFTIPGPEPVTFGGTPASSPSTIQNVAPPSTQSVSVSAASASATSQESCLLTSSQRLARRHVRNRSH